MMNQEAPDKNERLTNWIKQISKAQELSDGELIDECFDYISNTFAIGTYEEALFNQLLDRFQIKAEILVTPKGITADGEDLEQEWADEIKENV